MAKIARNLNEQLLSKETKMNIINLTPHTINILRSGPAGYEEIISIPPSGQVARLDVSRKEVGNLTEVNGDPAGNPYDGFGGVSLQNSIFGEPTELPYMEEGTIYIVSSLFRSGFDRPDLWVPGELIRNSEGQPIGCLGLSR